MINKFYGGIMIKSFEELTLKELYEILKVRAEIFVVEQNIVYQDCDDIDYRSFHVFYKDENERITAYLRLFYKLDEPGTVRVGRALTRKHGEGLGGKILKEGIEFAFEKMKAIRLFMDAQEHAIGFYEKYGFRVISDRFIEEDIYHVEMELIRE